MSTPAEVTEPTSDPNVVPTSSPLPESSNTSALSDEEAKARIRIGSQRQGSAPVKVPSRVVTEFKTGDAPNPQKQVFVRLDQEGNFQPLESASPPAANGNSDSPAVAQVESAAAEQTQPTGEGFRPKPAPLAFTAKSDKPIIEKVGPKIAVPSTRGKLSDDLEAELAAALGEDGSLEEMIDKSAVKSVGATIEPDTKVTGKVLRVTREFVFVDLPGMNQGAIQTLLFEDRVPEVGAPLEVRVVRFIAEEGIYECTSGNSAISVADWSQVSEGMVVEARITGHNKGGLECEVSRLRGFIPAGQISLYRIEDFSTLVGEKMACVITQASPERRNLVLSRKAVLEREQEEAKGKLLAELEVGQEREGIVRSLRDFGAFVDLGGMDGLIHISQMSWERVKHPKDVLTEGQRVKVKIQKIDPTNGKISLSLRDFIQNPWDSAAQKYAVGTKIKGTVTRIMEFGAFVKLEPGVEGLVHVSELSYKRVWRVGDMLTEGQEVEAKVLAVDPEKQRISLSIKAYEAHPEPEVDAEPEPEEAVANKPVPTRTTPLKGGLSQGSGGEQFGLKW